MKVLHISTGDATGAGLCALRICESLQSVGIESRLLVRCNTIKQYDTNFNELYFATWFPKNIYRVLRLYKAYVKHFPEKKQLIRDAMTCGIFKDFSRLENYKQ